MTFDHYHAEIQYDTSEGPAHSDICQKKGSEQSFKPSQDWREMLHKMLDEWLDRSDGTGHFAVGNWYEDAIDVWGPQPLKDILEYMVELIDKHGEHDSTRFKQPELKEFLNDMMLLLSKRFNVH